MPSLCLIGFYYKKSNKQLVEIDTEHLLEKPSSDNFSLKAKYFFKVFFSYFHIFLKFILRQN